jgi:hypothetical protein
MLTQKRLKELLYYNSRTGIFIRKIALSCSTAIGDVVGTWRFDGYLQTGIDGKKYLMHRLAWLYVKGKWPKGIIDHKDTIRYHNWIKNLCDVTHSGNQHSRTKPMRNNKLGVLGVHFDKQSGMYRTAINIKGKRKNLGKFSTIKKARRVYLRAKNL